jgi:hypothetical protein
MTPAQRALTDVLTEIRDFRRTSSTADLASKGFAYTSAEDFVLQHGEWFEPIPLPSEYEYGPPKSCFGTAIALSTMHGLTYVEGYGYYGGAGFPIPHAWNTDAEGRLIDATWGAFETETPSNRVPMPDAAYLGIRFSVGRADDATWNGDGSVLDDWKRRWPIFKHRWEGEDFDREWPNPSPMLRAHYGEISLEEAFDLVEAEVG